MWITNLVFIYFYLFIYFAFFPTLTSEKLITGSVGMTQPVQITVCLMCSFPNAHLLLNNLCNVFFFFFQVEILMLPSDLIHKDGVGGVPGPGAPPAAD